MTMDHIRKATAADIPGVLEVERLSFPHPWTEGNFTAALQNIFLVYDAGQIDGFIVACGEGDNRQGFILKVAVKPANRGRGIGSQLMLRALALLKETGTEDVKLEVKIIRPEAKRFYEKFGFEMVKVVTGDEDYEDDSLAFYEMRLNLREGTSAA